MRRACCLLPVLMLAASPSPAQADAPAALKTLQQAVQEASARGEPDPVQATIRSLRIEDRIEIELSLVQDSLPQPFARLEKPAGLSGPDWQALQAIRIEPGTFADGALLQISLIDIDDDGRRDLVLKQDRGGRDAMRHYRLQRQDPEHGFPALHPPEHIKSGYTLSADQVLELIRIEGRVYTLVLDPGALEDRLWLTPALAETRSSSHYLSQRLRLKPGYRLHPDTDTATHVDAETMTAMQTLAHQALEAWRQAEAWSPAPHCPTLPERPWPYRPDSDELAQPSLMDWAVQHQGACLAASLLNHCPPRPTSGNDCLQLWLIDTEGRSHARFKLDAQFQPERIEILPTAKSGRPD